MSGGLDSAVCLSIAKQECGEIHPLAFNYGQRTLDRELRCARELTRRAATRPLQVIELGFMPQLTHAALCNAGETVSAVNEYVPFRNAIMLSLGTAFAEPRGASALYIGSTGEDHICRDNSPAFRAAFQRLIEEGINGGGAISVFAPLESLDKTGVVRRGFELETPLEWTWSCHNNLDEACMACSNCTSRAGAFAALGLTDPALAFKDWRYTN